MAKEIHKKKFHLQLNNIEESNDPTKASATFIILDFDKSHNNTIITKEVCQESLSPTIINKPIIAKYNSPIEAGDGTDHFEGHNPYLDENRDGELTIKMDTTPIGVFTTEGYVMEVNTENGIKEVLAADAILWKDRFEDAVSLLMEWHENNININTSCELLYQNYEVKDGVEYINTPIWFSGHAVLNSEERGDYPVVKPAYDSSKLVSINELQKFNRLVAEAMHNEEDGKVPEKFKKVFELSHNDIRTALYKVLDAELETNQYSWIRDVYEDRFIAEIDTVTEDSYKSETYKFNYTKSDDDKITIDFNSKTEVMKKTEWIELEETQNLQAQIAEKDEKIKSLSAEKEDIQGKFNEASQKLTSLNSTVEELSEYKEKFEQAQFEEKLEEKQELYSAKFSALGATDKFESDEVQGLIEKAVSDIDAEVQLNSMIVDLIEVKNENDNKDNPIIQLNNERKDLVPTETDFDSRYK